MSDEPKFDQPYDGEPTTERQGALRAAYEANVKVGRPPYAGVAIGTRNELQWILRERGWAGTVSGHAAITGVIGTRAEQEALQRKRQPQRREEDEEYLGIAQTVALTVTETLWSGIKRGVADVYPSRGRGKFPERRTRRYGVTPGSGGSEQDYADLREANLFGINLAGVSLQRANLSGANLRYANLRGTNLLGANLRSAYLWDTDLTDAVLRETNLAGADLGEAVLHGADLRLARMDVATVLIDCSLNAATLVADVAWNGAPLSRVDLSEAATLGDEANVQKARNRAEQAITYRIAARAYRELATALRSQGLSAEASRYRQREQLMERRGRLTEGKLGQWAFSWLLNIVSGYGDKPGRALVCYLGVIAFFAATYFTITNYARDALLPTSSMHLHWYEALVLSISSFHGRGFFPTMITLGDPVALVAAAEAIIGLFIELVFIATFTQRFFAR